jgi:hypothetical protein
MNGLPVRAEAPLNPPMFDARMWDIQSEGGLLT